MKTTPIITLTNTHTHPQHTPTPTTHTLQPATFIHSTIPHPMYAFLGHFMHITPLSHLIHSTNLPPRASDLQQNLPPKA